MSFFIKNLTISQKLIFSYLSIGIAMLVVVYFFYYQSTKSAIISRTHDQLSSVMNLKKGWLESYFSNQKTNIAHFNSFYSTKLTFSELDFSLRNYGSKSKAYSSTDSLFGNSFYQFKESNHYQNVWLINKKGEIIYTSVQNGYLGKNIADTVFFNPKLKKTAINSYLKPTLSDLSYLSKQNSNPYVIIIAPVFDYGESLMGYILVKFNTDEINNILTQRSGMGETGESYVVDNEYNIRSISRFINDAAEKKILVSTPGVTSALNGKGGRGIFKDYRKIEVMSCFSPLKIDFLNWVLLSEIDYDEAMRPVQALHQKMIAVGLVMCILLLAITLYLSSKISKPISDMNLKMRQLSQGILPNEKLEIEYNDEIGQIIISLNLLVDSLKKTAEFAREIGSGNFSVQYSPLGNDDILGHALIEMRNQLQKLSQQVEHQNIVKTISLIEGQENERRRISMELHDGIGQMLTALKFKVQELDAENAVVKSTKLLLDEVIQETRRVAVNLVPSVLYDFGIKGAIRALIKNVDLAIEFTFTMSDFANEPNVEKRICLYRISQEAIQNIQKYAKTSRVNINLTIKREQIVLCIEDFGIGFEVEKILENNITSNGLRNMKERALLIGGTFEVNSQIEVGTKITVSIPT